MPSFVNALYWPINVYRFDLPQLVGAGSRYFIFSPLKRKTMTDRITYGFKIFRDNDLISFGYDLVGGIKGNVSLPNPPEALAELEKTLPEYQEVISKARKGDKEMRYRRKALRLKILSLIAELGEFVTLTANGDGAILVSSGFEVNKAKGTKAMKPIKEVKVRIEKPGEAVTEVKRVAGARVYVHQYTADPLTSESVWVNKVTTNPNYTFTGLDSKEKYWFQVIAIGINDQEAASTPVSRVIQ